MWIFSLIVFILVLGLIVLVHEFGHFICAKKSGVYIYEFSIGMGPLIFSHKGKDGINYNIRALPIGGFVQMAGEVYEDDGEIPKEKFMCNRLWYQRLAILVAGVFNNFVLAIVLLFILAIIWGPTSSTPKVLNVQEDSAASTSGMQSGDIINAINGHKFTSWDVGQIYLYYKNNDNMYTFDVTHENGQKETLTLVPKITKDEKGNETKTFGIQIDNRRDKNFIECVKFAFQKFIDIMKSMAITVWGLLSGQVSVSNLSGPVGIYKVVDQSVKYGIQQLIYITAFLSINVGFINILPFPAFDGGHVFFMILEKLKGSKLNAKFENTCNMIGFALLMLLMLYITVQDIIKFF